MPTLEQLRREVYEANLGIWRGGLGDHAQRQRQRH